MSSLAHKGIGVPQYLFLDTFQSLALEIQFLNRPSPTYCGTLDSIRYRSYWGENKGLPAGFVIVRDEKLRVLLYADEPHREGTVDQRSTGSMRWLAVLRACRNSSRTSSKKDTNASTLTGRSVCPWPSTPFGSPCRRPGSRCSIAIQHVESRNAP